MITGLKLLYYYVHEEMWADRNGDLHDYTTGFEVIGAWQRTSARKTFFG